MSSHSGKARRRKAILLGSFQNDLCFFCNEPMVYLDPEKVYEHHSERGLASQQNGRTASFDHYISQKAGGSSSRENTVMAHRDCNSAKGHDKPSS